MSENAVPADPLQNKTPPNGDPADGPPSNGPHRWDKVYFSELDEVYLLLDFIAGRPDRNVNSLEVKLSDEVDDRANPGQKIHQVKTLNAYEIVKRISKLRYPELPEPQRSEDAAFVLMVKDRLCALAYPATAQSIAFTTFVTETTTGWPWTPLWRRVVARGHSLPAEVSESDDFPEIHPKLRVNVAHQRFPEFEAMAARFCRFRRNATGWTLFLAFIGALLLAETTYGGQLSARLQGAKRDAAATAEKIYAAYGIKLRAEDLVRPAGTRPSKPAEARIEQICSLPTKPGPSADSGEHDTKPVGAASAPSQPTLPVPPPPPAVDPVKQESGQDNSTLPPIGKTDLKFVQYCDDYAYSAAALDNAIADVDAFARSWAARYIFPWVTPTHKTGPRTCEWLNTPDARKTPKQMRDEATCGPRQETGPSISVMVSGFANYILPLIFGVVGALSALIRGIQDRIIDSVLVPRDRSLLWFRIVLGVVAGGSVALFFDPVKVAAEITSGNPGLSVSASGIAFLAGYGAPAFFAMIDKIISRVFDFRDDHQPVNGLSPIKRD